MSIRPFENANRTSAHGRVCGITKGRFADAKREEQWLPVGPLWSNPAGRLGSRAALRGFDQATVELPSKLAGSTVDIRENPDPTLCGNSFGPLASPKADNATTEAPDPAAAQAAHAAITARPLVFTDPTR
jgi:hypothetical protein